MVQLQTPKTASYSFYSVSKITLDLQKFQIIYGFRTHECLQGT